MIEDSHYSQIKTIIEEKIIQFQSNQLDDRSQNERIASFFFLDFLQANYGLVMTKFEKGDKFKEKMNLMSTSLQLQEELKNLAWYVESNAAERYENQENKIEEFKEEILMIYSFFHLLLSKNQNLFSNPEMEVYCQTYELDKMTTFIERIMTKIIESNEYYLNH
jgi:hypothetical protein